MKLKEKTIGLPLISDPILLSQALTHSSYSNENPGTDDYERLEYLGDAVVGLVVATKLFKDYPHLNEGDLTKLRADIVNEKSLAAIAAKLNLGELAKVGNGSRKQKEQYNSSVLSDLFESITGAYYIDSSFKEARIWLEQILFSQ